MYRYLKNSGRGRDEGGVELGTEEAGDDQEVFPGVILSTL